MTTKIADDLVATVQEAAERLRGLELAEVSYRPSPDRWTIKQVIGHLIDSAANNHQRFVRAQLSDEIVFPKYDQNEWVSVQDYDSEDWQDLLNFWVLYNRHLAHTIRHVGPKSLHVKCTIGDYGPVTLQFLIEDYVVHLKHHLAKITERLNAKP